MEDDAIREYCNPCKKWVEVEWRYCETCEAFTRWNNHYDWECESCELEVVNIRSDVKALVR